jgi:hypothetical protein
VTVLDNPKSATLTSNPVTGTPTELLACVEGVWPSDHDNKIFSGFKSLHDIDKVNNLTVPTHP